MILLSPPFLIGQQRYEVGQVVGVSDGLPSNQIQSIQKDPEGFMWIGTSRGLCRWDGKSVRTFEFNSKDSTCISGNRISSEALCMDTVNRQLIVGTENGMSIYHFDTHHFENIFIDSHSSNGLKSDVHSIIQDRQGIIWVGTNNGIAKLNIPEYTFNYFSMKQENFQSPFIDQPLVEKILALQQDVFNDSIIWAGTLAGLLRFNKLNGRFHWYYYNAVDSPKEMNTFTRIVSHSNQKLYIATWNADMVIFDTRTQRFEGHFGIYETSETLSLQLIPGCEKSNHELWVSSIQGLGIFDTESNKIKNVLNFVSPAGNRFMAAFAYSDENRKLWLTSDYGAFVVNDASYQVNGRFQNYFFEPTDEMHWFLSKTVCEDPVRKSLLIGYGNGLGLHTFDLVSKQFGMNKLLGQDNDLVVIPKILILPEEGVFVLGIDQLYEWSHDQAPVNSLQLAFGQNPGLTDMVSDGAGNLWISSGIYGLLKYSISTGKLEAIDCCINYFKKAGQIPRIIELCYDSDGRLWFHNDVSYGYYDITGNKIHYFDGLRKQSLRCFFKEQPDTLWAASEEGTFGFIDCSSPDSGFHKIIQMSQNKDYRIQDMERDGAGNFWLLTNRGVEKFRIGEKSTLLFNQYQGLVKYDQWTNRDATIPGILTRLSDGRMVVGYRRGLGFFYPDSLMENHESFRPYVSVVKLFDHELPLNPFNHESAPSQLHHDQNFLSFDYSALSLYHGNDIRLAHQLTGVDQDWVLSQTHHGAYSNLTPGHYHFKVRAGSISNPDQSNEMDFSFIISPPWWNTYWAYALFFIMIIAIWIWGYRMQLNRVLVRKETQRLRELEEFKSRIFTNITHEFRSPLTVISGITENLIAHLEPSLKQGFEARLKMVMRNSQTLQKLIDQLLDLAKLQVGKLKLNLEYADIIPYLKYVIESFQSFAESRNIKLVFYDEAKKVSMDFDRDKIFHIVSNLISNAIKYTEDGGSVVFHSSMFESKKNQSLILKVTDTGLGISPTDLPHVFNRFYQANYTKQGQGSGVGLALAKELTELMEGQITVKSQPGKGSEFKVVIPISKQAQPLLAPQIQHQEDLISNDKKATGSRPHILIIEDNPDVADYIKLCLKNNYKSLWQPDGKRGIESAMKNIPDLVICDVMMPGPDGFEVCKTLKRDERTNHIPVVLLTAKSTEQDRIEGLSFGADAYITKPFNRQELLVRLDHLIKMRRQLQIKYSQLKINPIYTQQSKSLEVFLQKAMHAIINHLDDHQFNADHLASFLNLSESQLYRKLKAITGKSPALYIRSVKLAQAQQMLRSGHRSISEISDICGFANPAWFSRIYKNEFGISPRNEKKIK